MLNFAIPDQWEKAWITWWPILWTRAIRICSFHCESRKEVHRLIRTALLISNWLAVKTDHPARREETWFLGIPSPLWPSKGWPCFPLGHRQLHEWCQENQVTVAGYFWLLRLTGPGTMLDDLKQWFSKCGSWTSIVGITWEFIKMQVVPRPTAQKLGGGGWGPTDSFPKNIFPSFIEIDITDIQHCVNWRCAA